MEEEVSALVATRRWSEENARISVRARHRCEYCDLDFFESLTNYRLWQKDHIVPVSAGGRDEMENYAAACFPCNVVYKAQWNPQSDVGAGASRESLIQAVREHVMLHRSIDETKFELERRIVMASR